MTTTINAIELLNKFVNQRAGLCFANYGDVKAYRAESREITKDRADYYQLLMLANSRYSVWVDGKQVSNLNKVLADYLTKTSGRLALKGDKLEYCTGQYFPTEYRPAANRVLANLVFASYVNEVETKTPNPVYKDGAAIRKAIARNVSRRIMNNYFN